MSSAEALRIGEFARRVGVSTSVLRAWERRYGLLQPVRSSGGFRLYTAADADRVARMRGGIAAGLSAAEAARAALLDARPATGLLEDAADRLLQAIRDYDEVALHAVLDESFSAFGLESVLRELILPTLSEIGREWEQGALTVSQEHFASNLIRARLLAMARLWGRGGGPSALLACVPGEHHDISLLAFGLVLRSHGWRILFLGADTPIATISEAVDSITPAATVIASFDPARIEAELPAITRLAAHTRLMLSGPGASDEIASRLGVRRLDGDLIAAAHAVAAGTETRDLSR